MKHVTFRIEKEILCKSTQALLTRRLQGLSRDLASQNQGPVPSMIDYKNRTEKGATALAAAPGIMQFSYLINLNTYSKSTLQIRVSTNLRPCTWKVTLPSLILLLSKAALFSSSITSMQPVVRASLLPSASMT